MFSKRCLANINQCLVKTDRCLADRCLAKINRCLGKVDGLPFLVEIDRCFVNVNVNVILMRRLLFHGHSKDRSMFSKNRSIFSYKVAGFLKTGVLTQTAPHVLHQLMSSDALAHL